MNTFTINFPIYPLSTLKMSFYYSFHHFCWELSLGPYSSFEIIHLFLWLFEHSLFVFGFQQFYYNVPRFVGKLFGVYCTWICRWRSFIKFGFFCHYLFKYCLCSISHVFLSLCITYIHIIYIHIYIEWSFLPRFTELLYSFIYLVSIYFSVSIFFDLPKKKITKFISGCT